MARPIDVAPSGPLALPITGLGRGWEAFALMALTVILLSLGLVALYSASHPLAQRQMLPDYYYVLRQAMGATIGLGILVFCAWLPHDFWQHLAWPMIIIVWLFLIVLVIPGTEAIAPEINGSRRWLRIGINIQPSEIAKVAVIVWTASLAVRKQDYFRSFKRGFVPFLAVWGAVMLPIALEPDFMTALLIGVLGILVVFAAGARFAHFIFIALLMAPLLWQQLNESFRIDRIKSFFDPSIDPAGAGFQVRQSLLALGSGGIAGVGPGQGRQKFGFLPEAHNDFIFSMIGEEWGFIGVMVIVILYLLMVLVGFRVASRVPDLFGKLLATGITSMIGLQAFLHMSVGLKLMPPTGLALPLISYGRSNLLVTLAALGILMSISRACERPIRGVRRAIA